MKIKFCLFTALCVLLIAPGNSPSATAAATDDESIRPFHVNIPKEAVADMRRRIAATKWPEKEAVSDATQGPGYGFPDDIDVPTKSWAEKAYPKLIHYNRLPKGGHFAAWEQPELFVQEMRAAFKSLR